MGGGGGREGPSEEVSLGCNLQVRRSQPRQAWKGSRWGDQHEQGPRGSQAGVLRTDPGTERGEGEVDSKSGLEGEEPWI